MRCVNGLYYPQLIDYQPYASEIQKGLDAALEGLVYIGNKNGNDYVSIEVDVFGIADRVAAEGSDIIVESLRTAAENVCDEESGALLAISQGMSSFHKSSQYCSRCGSKTASKKFGASRICTNEDCNARSYPRLEPAASKPLCDE
jgi:NADH pyrophosphatase NudC (nudix superfamily)